MQTPLNKIPELNDFYSLSKTQVDNFQTNGHICLRNVLNDHEIKAYKSYIIDAAAKYNEEKRKLEDRDTYGKAFLQIMNLWQHDAAVKKFVLAKRFAKIAAQLMGVENVRLYHDQALFKEAGGGATPWHIDHYYWPLDTQKTITMWMPLVTINEEMGMLTFASGSHQKELVFKHEISDDSDKEVQAHIDRNNFPISRVATMQAGDATFHYGNTIHGAPGNNSDKMRSVMTIIFFADGAKITEPKNEGQRKDLKQWLGNKPVGHLADSSLNPVLL